MTATKEINRMFYLDQKSKNSHVNEYTNGDVDTYSDLVSYGTRVASYHHNTNEMSIYGWFSNTTAKHINLFLEYYGFDRCSKKEMENYK